MSVQSKMTAIADKIRQLTNVQGTLTLDAMSGRLNDVAASITAMNEEVALLFEQFEDEFGQSLGSPPAYSSMPEIIAAYPDAFSTYMQVFVVYYDLVVRSVTMINEINGTITSTGGSEVDVIVQELGKILSEMQSAYTAISEMGGTLPDTQTMGGLDDAVRSIPSGIDVKTSSGTLTTNSSGTATVNCGFKPDLVVITGLTYTYGSEVYEYQLSFCFPLKTGGNNAICTAGGYTNTYSNGIDAEFTQTSNGFSVLLTKYSGSGAGSNITNTTFNYTAIKYTA